jgi:hypothetical protein
MSLRSHRFVTERSRVEGAPVLFEGQAVAPVSLGKS